MKSKNILNHVKLNAKVGGIANVPLTISAESSGGMALIRIIGRISEWSSNNSQELGMQIFGILATGINDVHVYINSQGGNVFEASEIVNLINKFTGKKTGEIGALAASAATYIMCSLDSVKCAKNTQYMIHKPVLGVEGNEDEIESQLQLLKNATADYLAVYAKKTGKTIEEIKTFWAKGDFWMNAQKAKELGFIDEIEGEAVVDSQMREVLQSCGAPFIPNEVFSNLNNNEMKIDPISIGLAADATDAQIQARIVALNARAAEADKLEADQKADQKAQRQKEIKELLDAAIADKRIKGDMRAKYESLFAKDFDSVKAVVEALEPVEKPTDGSTTSKTSAQRKDWTFADWQSKDPEGLNKMRTENEAEFQLLMDAHYQTN